MTMTLERTGRPCRACGELARQLYGVDRIASDSRTSIVREADGPDGLCRYHRDAAGGED